MIVVPPKIVYIIHYKHYFPKHSNLIIKPQILNTLMKMKRSADFFRDEIRNGFYVPAAIKQAWAAVLDVLEEIDRICEKHGITYFADWGTILGAVRHGGFIPWDDDLDICMKRDDYERFRSVADSELPENFCIHDYERHEDHWLFLSRVVNNSKMCFDPSYLNTHNNFPWLAGVDIFVKDYLYPETDKELQRDKEILEILACADGIISASIRRANLELRIKELNNRYGSDISLENGDREAAVSLYKLAEMQMKRVQKGEAESIGQIFPWILKNGPSAGEPSRYYEQVIRLPFEDTTIPVPAYYNRVLSQRYGNYNVIRKVWSGHDYPFFEAQKQEMKKLGGALPEFSFKPEMMIRPATDRSGSLKTVSSECLSALAGYSEEIKTALSRNDGETALELLTAAQEMTVDLGTLIENALGTERPSTAACISSLEKYCDGIFHCYQAITDTSSEAGIDIPDLLEALLEESRPVVTENILNKKEVLFLTTDPRKWKGFAPFYEKYASDENYEVFVVPLPLITRDIFGSFTMSDEEIRASVHPEEYTGKVSPQHIADFSAYDISMHCPETVYIQDPYDGENPVLSVPGEFYTEYIRKYTGELIFVLFGRTAEFTENDLPDIYNLKSYVTAPGIVFSDKVYVQSENIKDIYMKVLTDFSGQNTGEFWKEKLIVNGVAGSSDEKPAQDKKKRILFCLGSNELSEKADRLESGLAGKLEILKRASDNAVISVALYPDDKNEWNKINKGLSEKIFSMLDKECSENGFGQIHADVRSVEEIAAGFDAYYGSSSPFVPAFSLNGKPVMIADFSI